MYWHLLNQHCVSLDYISSRISVLEEVLSSEAQLVQVLVSGHISTKTMRSVNPERYSLIDHTQESHL